MGVNKNMNWRLIKLREDLQLVLESTQSEDQDRFFRERGREAMGIWFELRVFIIEGATCFLRNINGYFTNLQLAILFWIIVTFHEVYIKFNTFSIRPNFALFFIFGLL